MNHYEELLESLKNKKDINIQNGFSGVVPLTQSYITTVNGDYVAKGIGLFWSGEGTIDFTGSIPQNSTILKGFLYWETVDRVDNSINLNGSTMFGTIIGKVDIDTQLGYVVGYYVDVTNHVSKEINRLTDFSMDCLGASIVIIYSNINLPSKKVIINHGIDAIIKSYSAGVEQPLANGNTISTLISNFRVYNPPSNIKTTYIVGGCTQEHVSNVLFNNIMLPPTNCLKENDGPYWDTMTVDVCNYVNVGDMGGIAGIMCISGPVIYIAQVLSAPTLGESSRGIKFLEKPIEHC